jgi:hypothetical protein
MDPLSIIVTAVVSGAAAASKDVAAQAVRDAYNGLKGLIVRKIGDKADVEGAIEGVEKRPDSKNRKGVLQEELKITEVDQDAEVVKQAQALLELLEEHGEAPAAYRATVYGSGAIAQGEGATAAGERGVAIGGDAQGPIITGDSSEIGQK